MFVNIGKAIAAYERTIEYGPSRFDRYVEALQDTGRAPQGVLTADEVAGLRLFIGKANCTQLPQRPAAHEQRVPQHRRARRDRVCRPTAAGSPGARCGAARRVQLPQPLERCRAEQCAELEFLVTGDHELERAFKVPSLRNVAERAPYMHAGQFGTLERGRRPLQPRAEGAGGPHRAEAAASRRAASCASSRRFCAR